MFIEVFISLAYGKVFLVKKNSGHDEGQLYAMKVGVTSTFSSFQEVKEQPSLISHHHVLCPVCHAVLSNTN